MGHAHLPRATLIPLHEPRSCPSTHSKSTVQARYRSEESCHWASTSPTHQRSHEGLLHTGVYNDAEKRMPPLINKEHQIAEWSYETYTHGLGTLLVLNTMLREFYLDCHTDSTWTV